VGSFVRYRGKDDAVGDVPFWLSAFTGEPHTVDRRTGDRPSIHVPSTAVTVFGTIQPAIWVRVMRAMHHESGLVARMLVSWPAPMKKAWSDAEASDAAVAAYEKLLTDLLAIEMAQGLDGPEPFPVRMTPEAHAEFVRFYGDWAERQFGADDEPRAMLGKLEAYCARFALMHHTVSRVAAGKDSCDPIEAESVLAGYELVKYFAAEAENAYVRLGEDEPTRQRRRLVEFIRAHGGTITPRKLRRSNRCRYPTAAAAESALNVLANAGAGVWQSLNTGGRPSKVFVLAPEPPPDPGEEGGDDS
jgi:hypothetical protein